MEDSKLIEKQWAKQKYPFIIFSLLLLMQPSLNQIIKSKQKITTIEITKKILSQFHFTFITNMKMGKFNSLPFIFKTLRWKLIFLLTPKIFQWTKIISWTKSLNSLIVKTNQRDLTLEFCLTEVRIFENILYFGW